ncbi:MAG: FAD-binding domain-containing protein, partial [Nostoc sp.]
MTKDMQREFTNRNELVAYLREQFPDAAERDDHISETLGGRQAAQKALQKI